MAVTEQEKQSKPPRTWVLVLSGLVAFGIALVPPLMYAGYNGWSIVSKQEAWNNFGTFVGGVVGPVLSTFAFFGLLVTVYLTQKQVVMAREALAGSRDQTVNAAFFEMVTLHNQIVAGIAFKQQTGGGIAGFEPTYTDHVGRKGVHYMFETMFVPSYKGEAARNAQRQPVPLSVCDFDRVGINKLHDAFEPELGHYFRNLYRILKYVNESSLDDKGQRTLTGILRAQLSNSELAWIFYAGKSEVGEAKLKPLLEKFAMFQNMSPAMCINRESALDYKIEAYGSNKDRFFKDQYIPEPDFSKFI